jgi:hypothetical protein
MHLNIKIDEDNLPPDTATLGSWPPADNTPIVTDRLGNVVSRYGAPTWDLTLWAGVKLCLDFGDSLGKSRVKNSPENADWYRRLTAWWMWRANSALSVATLKSYHQVLAKFFTICSLNKISVSELHKYPAIIDLIVMSLSPGSRTRTVRLLHVIYENRHDIGFFIISPEEIAALNNYKSGRAISAQTAYIPPRIWEYQVRRLKEFLDDYMAARDNFENLHQECIDRYISHYGSVEGAFASRKARDKDRSPFYKCRGLDSFSELVSKHGLTEVFSKWMLTPGTEFNGRGSGIVLLSSYTTLAMRVGIAFLLNFTTMRIDEAWKLRSDCLTKETDPVFGDFWTITGVTTKTMQDSDARWVTSPAAALPVQVMQHVAKLRMKSAEMDPAINTDSGFIENPFLVNRNYDPWSTRTYPPAPMQVRPNYAAYTALVREFPNLFDPVEISISKEDLRIARLITPTLDLKKFDEGQPWAFCWHQTRRTGAVNMLASRLVSEASLQFNLKHQVRFQSLFYGQGHSRLIFNEEAKNEYIKAFYDFRSVEVDILLSERFSSPHGKKHKNKMMKAITKADLKSLVSYRPVFLGVCLNDQYCSYGGIDHISNCGAGDGRPPCSGLLYDTSKLEFINELKADIQHRQETAPDEGPYADSLRAQLVSADAAIEYIIISRG